jgi:hypothetical protein
LYQKRKRLLNTPILILKIITNESDGRKIIPLSELEVDMNVETPDGKFRAVVEARNATGFTLKLSLFNGQEADMSIPYSNTADIDLVPAEEKL